MGLYACLAVSGCSTPQGIINPLGPPCATDADCKSHDTRWLCDLVTDTCVCPTCPEQPTVEESDGDNESEGTCYSCYSDNDCAIMGLTGFVCEPNIHCCISGSADGDGPDIEYAGTNAIIKVSPTTVDFGAAVITSNITKTVEIFNIGTEPLTIYTIWYDNISYTQEFTIPDLPSCALSGQTCVIKALGRIQFSVNYQPVDQGIDEAKITIVSNASNGNTMEVILKSQYKGDADICMACWCEDPDANTCPCKYGWDENLRLLDFFNVDVGGEPAHADFKLWNCGDATGNKVLVVERINMLGYNNSFFATHDPVSPSNPLVLAPKGTLEPDDSDTTSYFMIGMNYSPTEPTSYPQVHAELMEIINNSDDVSKRNYTINLQGSAENLTIEAAPNPVDFGTVEYGYTGSMVVHLRNRSPNDMLFHKLGTVPLSGSETPTDSFRVSFDTPVDDLQVAAMTTSPVEVELLYEPQEKLNTNGKPVPREDHGYLVVQWCKTSTEGCTPCTEEESSQLCDGRLRPYLQYTYIPIKGKGKPANTPPEAFISLQSHGPRITQPIPGLSCGATQTFFGDISQDDDSYHELCEFRWSWRNKPAGSQATIRSEDYYAADGQWVNVVVEFDISGTYELELDVRDCDAINPRWNENTNNWVQIDIDCDKGMGIILDWDDCEAKAEVDLMWCSPMRCCSPSEGMQSNGTCNLAEYGAIAFLEQSPYCSMGRMENMVHMNPTDAWYRACAKLVKNCDRFGFTIFGEEVCLWTAKPHFNMIFYDPEGTYTSVLYTVEGDLSGSGDTKCWRIQRIDGEWPNPPQ